MRFVSCLVEGVESLGVLEGEQWAVVHELGGASPRTMAELISGGRPAIDAVRARRTASQHVQWHPVESATLLAPIPRPGKIVAIGRNYPDHAAEEGLAPPPEPLVFTKFPSSVIGPGAAVVWDPALTSQVDFEAELAVVIGRRARSVPEESALDYVFGYTCLNDVSARDLQFGDGQWVRGKSLDTFCPMGPALVTADEIPDPHALAISCHVSGEPMQMANTREMFFSIPALISHCSRSFTLDPGDVIATGTPAGVGVFRKPPVFLRHGDVVSVTIERIGTLENTCYERTAV